MKRHYRIVLWVVLVLLLSGCGFHLKGYQQATPNLDGLYIQGDAGRASLAAMLRQELSASGAKLAASEAAARHHLQVLKDQIEYRALSVDANGKALEYELKLTVEYQVTAATGEQRIEPQSLQVLRQLIYNGTEELGRRNEAALVQQEVRRNLAGQILRQLQARL